LEDCRETIADSYKSRLSFTVVSKKCREKEWEEGREEVKEVRGEVVFVERRKDRKESERKNTEEDLDIVS